MVSRGVLRLVDYASDTGARFLTQVRIAAFQYNIIAGRELVNCLFCLLVFERMVYHPFGGTFSARFFLYSFLGSVILQSQRIVAAPSSVSLYSCSRSCKKPKVLSITIGSASFMSKNISANASKLLETSKILSIAS